jgi:hypothetical protein
VELPRTAVATLFLTLTVLAGCGSDDTTSTSGAAGPSTPDAGTKTASTSSAPTVNVALSPCPSAEEISQALAQPMTVNPTPLYGSSECSFVPVDGGAQTGLKVASLFDQTAVGNGSTLIEVRQVVEQVPAEASGPAGPTTAAVSDTPQYGQDSFRQVLTAETEQGPLVNCTQYLAGPPGTVIGVSAGQVGGDATGYAGDLDPNLVCGWVDALIEAATG